MEWYRQHRGDHNWKMKDLYQMVGLTKQAHYKAAGKCKREQKLTEAILEDVIRIRQKHPRLGARKLYTKINPQGIGRDKFEEILFSHGLKLKPKRSYIKTTRRHRWYRFDNLITGRQVNNANQVWVSDITYIQVGHKKYFYLILIQDIYTKKIVGWSLSDNLRAENLITAFKRAIRGKSQAELKGLIFHSDRGSQYLYCLLLALQKQNGIIPSMGNKAWENAHAESINGVLKVEYLNLLACPDLKKMRRKVREVIYLYNNDRPHGTIKMKTPVEFEKLIQGLAPELRPRIKVNY